MGINRIKLANGTENMKNLQDARMQQTYQQNIADNQAQQAVNQQNLNVGRNRILQRMQENQANQKSYSDLAMPFVNLGKGLLTGAGEPIITDTMRKDLIQRAEAKGGDSGALGYEDYGLEANTGGRFAGGITDIINDPQAFANAATVGRVTYDRDPETGEYSFGDTNYDFNVEDTDTGLGANLLKGINEGGLTGAISNLLTPSTAAAAEPSAMPQGSPGQLNPTPTPDASGKTYYDDGSYTIPGFTRLKDPDGAPGNYNEFMYKGPDGQIYGAQTYGSISAGQYPDIYNPNKEMMPTPEGTMGPISLDDFELQNRIDAPTAPLKSMGGELAKLASGGRVGFQEGTDPKLTARQVAEQNPELDAMRQKFFGTNYLDDIDQGNTGTVQYYSGLGNPNNLQFTKPVVETPAVDTSTPIVDSGDGGGGTLGPINLDDFEPQNQNTDFEQSLLDQGVGVQGAIGDPVVAPGEMLSTQAEMDAFNQIPVNREYGEEMNIGYGEGQVDPGLAAAVGGQDTTPLGGSTITGPTGDVYASDDPLAMEKIDFQTPEQTNAIGNAFNSIKDAGAAGVGQLKDSLTALGGKVKEGFDNVIEIGGKSIDIGKSLASGVLSLATGIPGIGLAINALDSLGSSDSQLQYEGFNDEQRSAIDKEYGPGGVMEGYNAVSAFGKGPLETIQERINNRYANVSDPENDKITKELEALRDKLGGIETVNATVTDDYDFSDFDDGDTSVAADVPTGSDPIGSFFDQVDNSAQEAADAQAAANQDSYRGGGGGEDPAPASKPAAPVYQDAIMRGQSGGGSDSSGGSPKIVCTMMNDSYGFGSFRNKIWMKFHKDLSPEYQKGYHKLFLPLVRIAKTNKVVKKILEHIAVHSTIDMRQATRGKTHLLGRVYRKILLPLCYWVGKYAK